MEGEEKMKWLDGRECKVQFRKPVTISGSVSYIEAVNKFQVRTDRGTSLLDPKDIIMIEELAQRFERHESEVTE